MRRIFFRQFTTLSDDISTKTIQEYRKIIECRQSVSDFDISKPISIDIIQDLMDLTKRAPSGFNIQPYRCIFVLNENKRKQLAECMKGRDNTKRILNSPLIAVFAADLQPSTRIPLIQDIGRKMNIPESYLEQLPSKVRIFTNEGLADNNIVYSIRKMMNYVAEKLDHPMPPPIPTIAWSYKQMMFAVESYVLALTAHGIGSYCMEKFVKDKIKEVLQIPMEQYSVAVVVAGGYLKPGTEQLKKRSFRLKDEEIFFLDKYKGSINNL